MFSEASVTHNWHYSSKISSWMVKRMPEHEDGHPSVLDPGLDSDGDDVLPLAAAELGEQAAEAEAKPW